MRAFLLSLCVVSLCASSDVLAESAAGIRWTAPVGPSKTSAAQQAAFDQMLASIQPE